MADIGLHVRLGLEELIQAAKRRAYAHAKARCLVGTITDEIDFMNKSTVEWKIVPTTDGPGPSPAAPFLEHAVVTWED